jgi:hypothetical protein
MGILFAAAMSGAQMIAQGEDNIQIALSMLVAAFPGLFAVLNNAANGMTLTRRFLSEEGCEWLTQSGARSFDPTNVKEGIDFGEIDLPADNFLTQWEIIGMIGILLFTLGKNVSALNFTQLTERRPLALAGVLKAPITQGGYLTAQGFPDLEWVLGFQGAFAMIPQVRSALVREIVAWMNSTSTTSLNQRIVCIPCRMWAGFGFTHVRMIASLLTAYLPQISQIGDLLVEAKVFMEEYESTLAAPPANLLYLKVISPQDATLAQRNYGGLFKLALELERRKNPQMRQYAAGTGQSPHIAHFTRLVEAAGGSLPTQVSLSASGI